MADKKTEETAPTEMFGITNGELEQLKSKERTCEDLIEQHRKTNPLLVTDLARRS